jgi:hypothetical protein
LQRNRGRRRPPIAWKLVQRDVLHVNVFKVERDRDEIVRRVLGIQVHE